MKLRIDRAGQRYGRLTAIAFYDRDIKGEAYWVALCDCGRVTVVRGSHLGSGNVQSCGCFCSESSSMRARTHGMSDRQGYESWAGMKRRCLNSKSKAYPLYGGRGITICDRWVNSLETFLKDMGPCPEGYTLERKNNDGNYEPNNCVWGTRTAQANNRRSSRFLTLNGKTMTVSEWSVETGIHHSAIHLRLKRGWSVEEALMTPLKKGPWKSWRGRLIVNRTEAAL